MSRQMTKYHKKATDRTPEVILDPSQKRFEIKGVSVPENVSNFYDPVITWLYEYTEDKSFSGIDLNFKFNYFNTSSLKALLSLFDKLKKPMLKGEKIQIIWHYHEEDESMKEAGELLQELCELPFVYLSYRT